LKLTAPLRTCTEKEQCSVFRVSIFQRTRKEWHHSSSSNPKKFRTQPPAGKIMLSLFWNERGVPWTTACLGGTISDLLKNHFLPAVRSKRRGLLARGVLLQQDNARPHTARATVATIQDLHCECLPHLPYSPNLAPSDYHSKRRWEERRPILMKRYNRRCMSRCADNRKNVFLEESIHIVNAGRPVLNEMETM
jgi:hypothetical protein